MKKYYSSILIFVLLLQVMQTMAVFGTGYPNLAMSAEVIPVTLRATNDHLMIVDGNKEAGKAAETMTTKKNSYVIFDFKERVSFNRVDVYEYNSAKVSRLMGYRIQASQDGETWETLSQQSNSVALCPEALSAIHFYGSIEFEKVTARFLKLIFLDVIDPTGDVSKTMAYVEEVEVFDSKPEEKARMIPGDDPKPKEIKAESSYEIVDYSQIIEDEANWIREQQIISPGNPSDGAVVMNKNNTSSSSGKRSMNIEPYFANMGLTSMLEHPSEENIEAARKWILWYIAHINRTPDKYDLVGTIYGRHINAEDYTDYWSTDEYSASDSRGTTFMILVKKYYDVTGDAKFLIDRKSDLELIFDSAAVATMKEDGLTEAKNQDGHRTKYLQDNVQVYAALREMVWLEENVFKDPVKTAYYTKYRDMSEKGIEGLWMEDAQEYIYYKLPNKTRLVDWNVFYGDAVSEVFPIRYGTMDFKSDRAIYLYNKFCAHHPGRVNRNQPSEFPWMTTALISANMDDKARTNEQLASMKKLYMDTGRKWTWYTFEAGGAISAAKVMRDKLNLALDKPTVGLELKFVNDGELTTSQKAKQVVIDLRENTNFNRVVVKTNSDIGNQFSVAYSMDNVTFVQTADNKDLSQLGDKIFADTNARYVKVTFPDIVDVKEVEVYYEKTNLAADKTAAASTKSEDAKLAVDSSTTTKWLGDITSDQWFKVDLGEKIHFNQIEIDWDSLNYDKEYSVLVSADDVNYREVKKVTDSRGGNELLELEPQLARYIKIVRNSKNASISGIFEVRVFHTIVENVEGGSVAPESYKIVVDKTLLILDSEPKNINDRLLVPFRAICEALDMKVSWDAGERKVTALKDGKLVVMIIGNTEIQVDGQILTSDVAPTISEGRTLIPLRFLAENIGADVAWDGETKTVTITQP